MATAFAKSSTGPAARHVLASHGASTYPLNFYSTTYSTTYSTQHGRHGSLPSAKQFRHKGTGYSANFRPTIYYSRQADLADNPSIAKVLNNVYDTSMSVDFKAPNVKNGFESLPSRLRLGPSGYTHNTPVTTALYHHKASSNTKYRAEYPKKTFREEGPPPSAHTLKETSGYSHSFNIEPVTYRPTECHSGEVPGEFTWRPTGKSLTKKDFTGWVPMSGHESLPLMTARANESNGYIKGNTNVAKAQPRDTRDPTVQEMPPTLVKAKRQNDPARFSLITHPHQYTSYTKVIYTPQGVHPYTNKTSDIGKKELSGYSDNTLPHKAPPDQLHYNTSSGDNFCGPPVPPLPLLDTQRERQPDGYTKSTCVHTNGSQYNPLKTIREQNPYVVKSILVQDPCFVDLTYRNKVRQKQR